MFLGKTTIVKCHNFWNLEELIKGMNGDCLGFSFVWKPRESNCRIDCLHFRSGSILKAIFGSEISLQWLLIEVTPVFSHGGVSGLSAEIGANFYPPLFSTSRIKVRLFNQLFFPFKLTFSALNILKMKTIESHIGQGMVQILKGKTYFSWLGYTFS